MQRHDVISDVRDNRVSTAHAAQIWFKMFVLDSLRKYVIKYAFLVPSLNSNVLPERTVRASMYACNSLNYRRVIVRIFTLRPMEVLHEEFM